MNMPIENPDLDERLARLAARRAASSGSKAKPAARPRPARAAGGKASASAPLGPAAQDRIVARRPERKRRAHPAAAGRILAAGLSTSAFLSLMAAFAARAPAAGAPVVATAPPRANVPGATGAVRHRKPKIVTKVRHHTVYVDQYGRPYSPLTAATPNSSSGTSGPIVPPSAVAPLPSTPVVTPITPAPPPPAPGGAPPVTAPAPAPAPTPRPAPPTTVFTPPPPRAPPPCSGTKCP
jgi:hypothetical protein